MARTKGTGSRRKKSSKRRQPTGARRGPPGNFHGERLQFLQSQLPVYNAAAVTGSFTNFWSSFYAEWYKKFPWWLPYDADPDNHDIEEPEPGEETDKNKAKAIKRIEGVRAPQLYTFIAANLGT